MPVGPKKKKGYLAAIAAVVVCLAAAGYIYKRIHNKSDMDNLLAIAGISGATVYTLEPTPALRLEIEAATSDPVEIVEKLEKALEGKIREHGEKRRLYSDPKSAAAMQEFETCYAYSVRILVLKKWKPGMKKNEIASNYYTNVKALTSQYDFKNNTEAFLGFK